jgi:hypothetical protein
MTTASTGGNYNVRMIASVTSTICDVAVDDPSIDDRLPTATSPDRS